VHQKARGVDQVEAVMPFVPRIELQSLQALSKAQRDPLTACSLLCMDLVDSRFRLLLPSTPSKEGRVTGEGVEGLSHLSGASVGHASKIGDHIGSYWALLAS
jgi:hypothetical protein